MFSPKDTLSLLQDLIRARSPNPPGDITAAAGVVTRLLDREGLRYQVYESGPGVTNLVATLNGSGSGKTLMFNGHLDVIPEGEGWTWNPYGGEFRDGYVHGRGSCDMKAGVVAALSALVNLKRSGAQFRGSIKLWLVGDEEYEGKLGTQHLLAQGLTADSAIICEPTSMRLVLGNRGLLWADVVVHGRASHGGRPQQGLNAVHVASEIIAALNALPLAEYRDDRFDVPTSSISAVCIEGGQPINVIPDQCRFSLDRRLLPGEGGDHAIQQILDTIAAVTGAQPALGPDTPGAVAPGDGLPRITVMPHIMHEPCWTPEDSEIAAATAEVYRRQFGRLPAIAGMAAATDASHLVHTGKIPTVIIGPGDFEVAHTNREKVEFAQVLQAAELYASIALEVLS